jgi:hypothetical protein
LDDKLHQFRLWKWCDPILKIIQHSGSNDLASCNTTTLPRKLIPAAWTPDALQDAHSDQSLKQSLQMPRRQIMSSRKSLCRDRSWAGMKGDIDDRCYCKLTTTRQQDH